MKKIPTKRMKFDTIIDLLSREQGYPAIKLSYSQYMKVLQAAHSIKYPKQPN